MNTSSSRLKFWGLFLLAIVLIVGTVVISQKGSEDKSTRLISLEIGQPEARAQQADSCPDVSFLGTGHGWANNFFQSVARNRAEKAALANYSCNNTPATQIGSCNSPSGSSVKCVDGPITPASGPLTLNSTCDREYGLSVFPLWNCQANATGPCNKECVELGRSTRTQEKN